MLKVTKEERQAYAAFKRDSNYKGSMFALLAASFKPVELDCY